MKAKYSFIVVFLFLFILITSLPAQKEQDRIPPGQRVITDFPLLHISDIPDLTRENWSLKVKGECGNPLDLDWKAFTRLDTVLFVSDFHCVTTWTRLDNHWKGVRIRDILKKCQSSKKAKFITFKSADGYTTSLPISQCTGEDDILAFRWEGEDLDKKRGGPVRVVIPKKYAYKSALWVVEMKLTRKQELGYWEQRGYSNTADPWKEERYTK
jgi:DMSO/TMAO reductase YedYZ molybdopterin-dependent catalytic subunit